MPLEDSERERYCKLTVVPVGCAVARMNATMSDLSCFAES
jgi:hypothetical protein